MLPLLFRRGVDVGRGGRIVGRGRSVDIQPVGVGPIRLIVQRHRLAGQLLGREGPAGSGAISAKGRGRSIATKQGGGDLALHSRSFLATAIIYGIAARLRMLLLLAVVRFVVHVFRHSRPGLDGQLPDAILVPMTTAAAGGAGGARPDGRRGRGPMMMMARIQEGIDARGGSAAAGIAASSSALAPALAPALASFGRADPALGPQAGQVAFRDDRICTRRIGRSVRWLGPEFADVPVVVRPRPRRGGHVAALRNETSTLCAEFRYRHKIRGEVRI